MTTDLKRRLYSALEELAAARATLLGGMRDVAAAEAALSSLLGEVFAESETAGAGAATDDSPVVATAGSLPEDDEPPPPPPPEDEDGDAASASRQAQIQFQPPVVSETMPPQLPPLPAVSNSGAPPRRILWTKEQIDVLDRVERWVRDPRAQPLMSLTGPAGTGKTTMAREVVRRVGGVTSCAMTGKAAVRLSEAVGASATTLHSLLYWPPDAGGGFTRKREPPDSTLVLIDEASMAGPQVVRDLWQWGPKCLLVGDGYQLPAVISKREAEEYGEEYSAFAEVRGVALTEVMRSAGGLLRAATRVRETGASIVATDLDGEDAGFEALQRRYPQNFAIARYLDYRKAGVDTILITWRNAVRMRANHQIRQCLGHSGPLPDEGEPVLIKKNGQGHLNGEIVECGGFEDGPVLGDVRTLRMTVGRGGSASILVTVGGGSPERGGEFMDGQVQYPQDSAKYRSALEALKIPEPAPITWAYCLSCHSAQGSQAERTIVFLQPGEERSSNFRKMTRLPDGSSAPFHARWIYTAMTRSTKYSLLVTGR